MRRLAALRTRVCVLGRPPLPAERLHPVALHAPLVVRQRDGRAVRVRAEPRRVVRQTRHGGRGRRRERARALRHRRARRRRALCRPRAAPRPLYWRPPQPPASGTSGLGLSRSPLDRPNSGKFVKGLILRFPPVATIDRRRPSRPPHRRPCASPSSGSFRRLPRRPRSFKPGVPSRVDPEDPPLSPGARRRRPPFARARPRGGFRSRATRRRPHVTSLSAVGASGALR